MLTRERDSQRSKVYRAENEAFKELEKTGLRFETTDEIKKYVTTILKTKWAIKRWGKRTTNIVVRDGRGRRRAGGRPLFEGVFLTMPLWSRKEWVVLHELAHGVTPRRVWHGWEFCHNYLQLVRFRLGPEAEKLLKASFRKHKVRFRPKRVRAPLSAERRAALVARLAEYRAQRLAAKEDS